MSRSEEDLRLSQLLGCAVLDDGGERLGVVTDVRLARTGSGAAAEWLVESLLVSRRHTGSLFGYERRREQGPALLRLAVRRLHRGAFLAAWPDVTGWDRDTRRITLRTGAERRSPEG